MMAVDVDRTTRVTLGRVSRLVTDVEADEQKPLWSQHSPELLEHPRQRVVGHMDHRPEGDDADDGVVGQVQVGHRTDLEA
jgi:hypothetical protein